MLDLLGTCPHQALTPCRMARKTLAWTMLPKSSDLNAPKTELHKTAKVKINPAPGASCYRFQWHQRPYVHQQKALQERTELQSHHCTPHRELFKIQKRPKLVLLLFASHLLATVTMKVGSLMILLNPRKAAPSPNASPSHSAKANCCLSLLNMQSTGIACGAAQANTCRLQYQ